MITLGRDGAWTVELVRPLPGGIDKITIQPISADHMIRWDDDRIPSFYSLLAELTGVTEQTLLKLSGVDLERVMFAFTTLMTNNIRQAFEKKEKPLSALYDSIPHPDDIPAPASNAPPRDPMVEPFAPDPIDVRFPDIGGPVAKRIPKELHKSKPSSQPQDDTGMNLAPPSVMEKVG